MSLRNLVVSALITAAATVGFAQPNRIQSKIDNARTYSLQGRVHPLAKAANDQGMVDPAFTLPNMTITLRSTPAQQAKLTQLLADQQNPASAQYHQWLTPEQYADQFGVSADDAAQIVAWLKSEGFTVDPVSRSRTFITFSGTAGQVQSAFGTTIHNYKVNGAMHYANSTDLTIPAALSPMVAGVRGLHDFHPKAHIAKVSPNKVSPKWTLGRADYVMAPDDFATIYNITPMYTAGNNGSGQKVAVVGQSAVSAADITHFWTTFGLSSVKLVQDLVNSRQNPGYQTQSGDADESALDVEWAGAIARGGTVVFVYSTDVWTSAMYAVDQNVAPVLSMSYGECEMYDLADMPTFRQTVQQANAQGITWLAAAGDQGSTDCDYGTDIAEGGLAVDEPGSIPEVTSMGGTSVSDAATYWNTTNSATNQSAKGYIPEVVWNDSAAAGQILATGGGASQYFAQPAWQGTAGVPADGWRHVPDLAFNASVYVVPYYVYCSVCTDTQAGVEYVGGTSAATPTMAGVVALLNQYQKATGSGNINPGIYNLFSTYPAAFHNNITGNNNEPCAYASPGCSNGVEGYAATGSGYSSAVGFGSIDVTQFIQHWSSAAPTGPVVVASLDQNPVYQGPDPASAPSGALNCGGTSSSWNFLLSLQEEGGFATTVTSFKVNGTDYTSQIARIIGSTTLGARQVVSGCMSLSGVSVPQNLTFNFAGPNWSTALTVPFQGPQAQLNVSAVTNAASYSQTYAPGMILAVFGTGLGTLAQAASTIPLPEYMGGVEGGICPVSCANSSEPYYPIPLYYVGPNQVNIQIPYEVTGPVDLNIGNPYTVTDFYFTIQTVAPGIFTMQDGTNNLNPSSTASAGQTTFLFITGEGKVSPALVDGSTPAAGTATSRLPKPVQAVTVTVGGVNCPTTFVGIPSGLVGVTQVNFTIPSTVPSGRQPVVVTVGTTSTPTAYITIQ